MSFDSDNPLDAFAPPPDDQSLPSPPPHTDRNPDGVSILGPQDLLTAIPYLLQYQPHHALVIALTRDRSILLLASADFSPPTPTASELWQTLSLEITHYRADSLYLIGYVPEPMAPVLRQCARTAPLPVKDLLRVHEGRWWGLGHENDDFCCPDGHPFQAQDHVVAPLAMAGLSVAASRDDLASSLEPAPPPVLERVQAELIHAAGEEWTATDRYLALWAAHQARRDGPVALTEADAARLLRALSHAWVRDACLDWHDDATWWLWNDLIRLTPTHRVPTVALLLAATAYQRGDTPFALTAAEHAYKADPHFQHTLNRAAFKLGRLLDTCQLDAEEISAELLAAGQAVGLSQREATTAIASGLARGRTQPRHPTRTSNRPVMSGGRP